MHMANAFAHGACFPLPALIDTVLDPKLSVPSGQYLDMGDQIKCQMGSATVGVDGFAQPSIMGYIPHYQSNAASQRDVSMESSHCSYFDAPDSLESGISASCMG